MKSVTTIFGYSLYSYKINRSHSQILVTDTKLINVTQTNQNSAQFQIKTGKQLVYINSTPNIGVSFHALFIAHTAKEQTISGIFQQCCPNSERVCALNKRNNVSLVCGCVCVCAMRKIPYPVWRTGASATSFCKEYSKPGKNLVE